MESPFFILFPPRFNYRSNVLNPQPPRDFSRARTSPLSGSNSRARS